MNSGKGCYKCQAATAFTKQRLYAMNGVPPQGVDGARQRMEDLLRQRTTATEHGTYSFHPAHPAQLAQGMMVPGRYTPAPNTVLPPQPWYDADGVPDAPAAWQKRDAEPNPFIDCYTGWQNGEPKGAVGETSARLCATCNCKMQMGIPLCMPWQ